MTDGAGQISVSAPTVDLSDARAVLDELQAKSIAAHRISRANSKAPPRYGQVPTLGDFDRLLALAEDLNEELTSRAVADGATEGLSGLEARRV